MSLDFDLMQTQPVCIFSTNMTHNVSGMWAKSGCYDALYNSEGKKASEVLPALKTAYDRMAESPTTYKKLDATNGWGTYDQALPWLKEVIAACWKNPEAIIIISK